LRNSKTFAEFAKTSSDFFEFGDQAKLDEYYAGFFKIVGEQGNDDLVTVLNSIKDVPKVFFEVSSKRNPLIRFFKVMHENSKSKWFVKL
jgi:hypothetical protein